MIQVYKDSEQMDVEALFPSLVLTFDTFLSFRNWGEGCNLSVIYSVIPVDETLKTQSVLDWLRDSDAPFPSNLVSGRAPTFHEIKQVLDNLPEHRKDYRKSIIPLGISVQIYGNFDSVTELDIVKYTDGTEETCYFSFHGGDYDLIMKVIQGLADICGTFLVMANGEDPIFITPQTNFSRHHAE
jgi:hypothetical protein